MILPLRVNVAAALAKELQYGKDLPDQVRKLLRTLQGQPASWGRNFWPATPPETSDARRQID